MTAPSRTTIVFVVIALGGYLAFAFLFPRVDRIGRAGVVLDASTAVQRAREAAARFGVNIAGGGNAAGRLDKEALRQSLGRDASRLPAELFGFGATVRFVEATGRTYVNLDGRGRLAGLYVDRKSGSAGPTDDGARAIGGKWLAILTAADAPAYNMTDRSDEGGAVHIRWTRRDDAKRGAEAMVRDAAQPRVRLVPLTPKQKAPLDTIDTVLGVISFLLHLFLIVAAIVAGAVALVRRQARFRWVMAAAVPLLVLGWAGLLTSPQGLFDPWMKLPMSMEAMERTERVVSWVIPLFAALFGGLAWAGARAVLLRTQPSAAYGMDALLRLRVSGREAGRSVLGGVASAGVIALLPLIVGLFSSGALVTTTSRGPLLFSAVPLIESIVHAGQLALLDTLLVFVLAASLLEAKFGRGTLASILTIAIGSGWLGEDGLYGPGEDLAGLLAGAVVTALLLALYRRLGPVAVVAALFSTELLRDAAALTMRPTAGSILTAAGLVVALIALAVVAGIAMLRGKAEETTRGEPVLAVATAPATERLHAEMELARSMQERLMGKELEQIPGFEISSVCRAAKDVGGDLYTVIPVRGDRFALAFAIADVAGKGLPAALTMTLTKGLLLGAAEQTADATKIASIVNDGIRASGDRKTFVTVVLAVLDPATRRCSVVRAGHTPALVVRAGSGAVESLYPRGLALGLSSQEMFNAITRSMEVSLVSGDALVLYSDGVTEAMNVASEEFGEHRLTEVLKRNHHASAAEIQSAIVEEVTRFRAGAAPNDDMTIAVIKAV